MVFFLAKLCCYATSQQKTCARNFRRKSKDFNVYVLCYQIVDRGNLPPSKCCQKIKKGVDTINIYIHVRAHTHTLSRELFLHFSISDHMSSLSSSVISRGGHSQAGSIVSHGSGRAPGSFVGSQHTTGTTASNIEEGIKKSRVVYGTWRQDNDVYVLLYEIDEPMTRFVAKKLRDSLLNLGVPGIKKFLSSYRHCFKLVQGTPFGDTNNMVPLGQRNIDEITRASWYSFASKLRLSPPLASEIGNLDAEFGESSGAILQNEKANQLGNASIWVSGGKGPSFLQVLHITMGSNPDAVEMNFVQDVERAGAKQWRCFGVASDGESSVNSVRDLPEFKHVDAAAFQRQQLFYKALLNFTSTQFRGKPFANVFWISTNDNRDFSILRNTKLGARVGQNRGGGWQNGVNESKSHNNDSNDDSNGDDNSNDDSSDDEELREILKSAKVVGQPSSGANKQQQKMQGKTAAHDDDDDTSTVITSFTTIYEADGQVRHKSESIVHVNDEVLSNLSAQQQSGSRRQQQSQQQSSSSSTQRGGGGGVGFKPQQTRRPTPPLPTHHSDDDNDNDDNDDDDNYMSDDSSNGFGDDADIAPKSSKTAMLAAQQSGKNGFKKPTAMQSSPFFSQPSRGGHDEDDNNIGDDNDEADMNNGEGMSVDSHFSSVSERARKRANHGQYFDDRASDVQSYVSAMAGNRRR